MPTTPQASRVVGDAYHTHRTAATGLQGYLPEPTRTYPNRAGARPMRRSHGPTRGPRRCRCWHRQPASRVQQAEERRRSAPAPVSRRTKPHPPPLPQATPTPHPNNPHGTSHCTPCIREGPAGPIGSHPSAAPPLSPTPDWRPGTGILGHHSASMNARRLSRCRALRNGKTGRISRATVTLSRGFPAAAGAPACCFFFFLFDGAACSSSSSAVDRARASSKMSLGVTARAAWLSR